jgi:hypothetical protein
MIFLKEKITQKELERAPALVIFLNNNLSSAQYFFEKNI